MKLTKITSTAMTSFPNPSHPGGMVHIGCSLEGDLEKADSPEAQFSELHLLASGMCALEKHRTLEKLNEQVARDQGIAAVRECREIEKKFATNRVPSICIGSDQSKWSFYRDEWEAGHQRFPDLIPPAPSADAVPRLDPALGSDEIGSGLPASSPRQTPTDSGFDDPSKRENPAGAVISDNPSTWPPVIKSAPNAAPDQLAIRDPQSAMPNTASVPDGEGIN
jgi:hypothetical protein